MRCSAPVGPLGTLRAATIVLEDDGRTTVINEPGPPLDDAVALPRRVRDALADQRPRSWWPPAACHRGTGDLYADVVRLAAEQARRGGRRRRAGLAAALRAGPALVKPNLAEAESVLRALAGPGSGPGVTDAVEEVDESGGDVPGRCAAAAEALVGAGARAALVSGGRSGAALHTGDRQR